MVARIAGVTILSRITLFACLLFLVGCDALNCVINNHPEFSQTSLTEARLNQVYEASIRASISNSIEDSKYDYEITLAGDLPPGIEYETNGRDITFSGTPTELGDFPITLSVVAEEKFFGPNVPEDTEPEALCSDTETRDMVLRVVQGF